MAGAEVVAEEMIDVITPDGVWTGVTLPKSQVHQQGEWHACVHGVITDGLGNVIAQYRGPGVKLLRNVWDAMSVAGHISALTDEERRDNLELWDLTQQAWRALVREFQEELGVDLSGYTPFSDDVVMFGITRTEQATEDGWRDRTLSVNFMIRMPHLNLELFKLEPGKVLDVQWVPISELEDAASSEGTHYPGDKRYAVRMPDNHHLMQGAADCAKRMLRVEDDDSDGEAH